MERFDELSTTRIDTLSTPQFDRLTTPLTTKGINLMPGTRAARYQSIWQLRERGYKYQDICDLLKVSERLVARAVSAKGMYHGLDAEMPLNVQEPLHGFKMTGPPSMRDPGYIIFYKACKNCGGDVKCFLASPEMECFQCAWNQRSPLPRAKSA